MFKRILSITLLSIVLFSCDSNKDNTAENDQAENTQADSSSAVAVNPDPEILKPISPKNFSYNDTVIEVHNFNEFYRNIGSNRTLKLQGKEFKFPATVKGITNLYNTMSYGMIITGVSNLKIIGAATEPIKLVQPDPSSKVLQFIKCENILLENIVAGHEPQKGGCAASVISLVDCQNIFMKACILYGSGYEGINALRTKYMDCQSVTIRECSAQIMSLIECSNIRFNMSFFIFNNQPWGAGKFFMAHTEQIGFNKCFISNNATDPKKDESLFNLDDCAEIYMKDVEIKNNKAARLTTSPKAMQLMRCTVSGNSWEQAGVVTK